MRPESYHGSLRGCIEVPTLRGRSQYGLLHFGQTAGSCAASLRNPLRECTARSGSQHLSDYRAGDGIRRALDAQTLHAAAQRAGIQAERRGRAAGSLQHQRPDAGAFSMCFRWASSSAAREPAWSRSSQWVHLDNASFTVQVAAAREIVDCAGDWTAEQDYVGSVTWATLRGQCCTGTDRAARILLRHPPHYHRCHF